MTRTADDELAERIAAYIAQRERDADSVVVQELSRIHGGASKETYRLRVCQRTRGVDTIRHLILRREPPSGMVESESDLEYTVYRALEHTGVPVPRVYLQEGDPAWLDRPFFIMELAQGRPGTPYRPDETYDGHGDHVARQFWRNMGLLAAIDHDRLGLTSLRNGTSPDCFWARELDHWEGTLTRNERIINPVVHAAIRWLRRNPPAPATKPAIVHGDYRSGNFLFTPDNGRITAMLDWEMCHIGDPLEDIAWSLNHAWSIDRYLPVADGIAIWEHASGLTVDLAALEWWRLFTAVKASAIWIAAEASIMAGKVSEPTVVLTPLRVGHLHRMEIFSRLEALGIAP